MKKSLKIFYQWWRVGLSDPRKIPLFPREIYRFVRDLRAFRGHEGFDPKSQIELHPIFFQRGISSTFDAHYVYQAAWAIRRIAGAKPAEHVDISSNIPYVAALSAVVPVRFCEYRPPVISLPGLSTQAADLGKLPFASGSVSSLSCLHVLEHVGLGRYGDPIDPLGLASACREIARVTGPGSSVLLSLPVGRERICFNMHRVSDPGLLPSLFGADFRLREFSVVTDDRRFLEGVSPADFATQDYACGLYWFEKAARD